MTAPFTRRGLVQAAGAALGVGVAGIPASALPAIAEAGIAASDPDAALLDLIARHGAATEAATHATAAVDALAKEAAALYPPEPEALLRREGDFLGTSLGGALSDPVEGDEEARRYGARAAAWLRERPAAGWFGSAWAPAVLARWEERKREVVEAWDASEAGRVAVDERTGLAAAERTEDDALVLAFDLACELKRSRPRTLAGLRALALWFKREDEAGAAHDDALTQLAAAVAAFGGAAS